jgi:protein transport protein SEC61 subunit gamma-like protein
MATTTVPREEKGVVGKAWEVQTRIESRLDNLGKGKYGRVIRMARKPTNEEWAKVAKITSLGMIAIGALGFVIYFTASVGIPTLITFFRGH